MQTAYAVEALWLVLVLSALLAASRAAFVVPFSLLHNKWSAAKLSNRDIVIVWWSGLMRGAVSVALVYYYFDDAPNQVVDRQRATLIATTLMVGIEGKQGLKASPVQQNLQLCTQLNRLSFRRLQK